MQGNAQTATDATSSLLVVAWRTICAAATHSLVGCPKLFLSGLGHSVDFIIARLPTKPPRPHLLISIVKLDQVRMGPPGFFSRVRAYGTYEDIGRTTASTEESQSQSQSQSQGQSTTPAIVAIIDGPSFAHFLYDKLIKDECANDKIETFYRYAELGEAAIKWLDNLCSLGFTM